MRTGALLGFLLGIVNAQWTATSMETSKYSNMPAQCKAEAWFPLFASSDCTRECMYCNAAVVIVIQLGCDVIHEIQPITESVVSVVRQFEASKGTLPGALRLGLVRYGLKQDIKIDLTLLDDINAFKNVINGVLIKNIRAMKPASNAHLVPAFKVALNMFKEYDMHHTNGYQAPLGERWMWYITNGHLQCADCICYPEIGNPEFYATNATLRSFSTDSKNFGTSKLRNFQAWLALAENESKVNQICTDFMTETEMGRECCFEGTCGHNRGRRVCTKADFDRNNCATNPDIKEKFKSLVTFPQTCWELNQRMKICFIRSLLLSMFELDVEKCNRLNQQVGIMVTAPNQRACVHTTHNFDGKARRIWTENQFEDCHNAEMLAYFNNWNINKNVCRAFGEIPTQYFKAPTCSAYESKMAREGTFHVDNTEMNTVVGNCLLSSAEKCINPTCRKTDCKVRLFVPEPTPRPTVGSPGCPGARGPSGKPGSPGKPGALGLPGVRGPAAAQGECGVDGPPGPPAWSPPRKVNVYPGIKGGVGADGPPGSPGDHGGPGLRGLPGTVGQKGLPGQPGDDGMCGPPGKPGPPGLPGRKGVDGPQGMPGGAGVGIESEEYYKKFKAMLRAQIEDALDKVSVDSNKVNGPKNAVLLYKQLAALIAQEINNVCKPGHDSQRKCYPPRSEIFYQWADSEPQCISTGDEDWPQPTLAPTTTQAWPKPTRTIPVFISQETRPIPIETVPPKAPTRPPTEIPTTYKVTDQTMIWSDDSDAATDSSFSADWESETEDWFGGKRKRNTDQRHSPDRKFTKRARKNSSEFSSSEN